MMQIRPIRDDADAWFDIPGYEDAYQINREGNVRSKPRQVNSPACGGARTITARPISVRTVKGYPAFTPCVGGKKRTLYLHRIMARLFVQNPDGKPHVNHIDGNKENFSPDNLEWCTHKENMRHAFESGLTPLPKVGAGDQCPSSKLNEQSVAVIKRRLLAGEKRSSIARDNGISHGAIYFISTGQTWAHVEAAT